MTSVHLDHDDFGPLYVCQGKATSDGIDLLRLLLVKIDDASSYLPSWFSEDGVIQFLREKHLENHASPTILTRSEFELTRRHCEGLGHKLYIQVNG